MTKKECFARRIGVAVCESVAIFSLIYSILIKKSSEDMLLAVLTVGLVLLPALFERLFRCKLCLPLYLFGSVYALSHLCGHIYYFYDRIPGYDKLLHTIGGVVFAIVGIYILYVCSGKKTQPLVCTAVFALCFSMAISMAWEFFEFGSDRLLGTDMQRDAVVTSINSYKLGEDVGKVGSITEIKALSINGEPLPFGGYLDIGLTDTMMDMILETSGAAMVALLYIIDKGRHPLIRPLEEDGVDALLCR